jgi:hypothetical protein
VIREFEPYHGAVVRALIVEAPGPLTIEACDDLGRVNSYRLNGSVGLHIKHSAKRLPPWQFTFNEENLAEIARLEAESDALWLALVCHLNGIVALSAAELRMIYPHDCDTTCFVRVDRDRRTMYRVFGTAGRLPSAKPRGVDAILAAAFRGSGESM